MYPDPLRPATKVCHYFAKQWVEMGHEVLVINYRSMFPPIYTFIAGLFPELAKRYVGNHVEMDRNMNIVQHNVEGIPVYSIPIFKYVPHGRYPQRSINKQLKTLDNILNEHDFVPDAIIGHFYNPQIEIVARLKECYPNAHTCVTLHELDSSCIRKVWPKNYEQLLNAIDLIGLRSLPIKKSFEENYGTEHREFHCCSGTPQLYLDVPKTYERKFSDGAMKNFLYVGQTIKRKFPKETAEGLSMAMDGKDYSLTYVGSFDPGYPETLAFVQDRRLEKQIIFTGKVPREEIIKYYDKSDCFILISKDEVFGLVYLEAMSRGCIVIAAKNESMEGIIENGVNGFLCEAGNSNELAYIIRHINSLSAEEKQDISYNGRATATKLSDYNVAKTYIDKVLEA